MDEDVDAAVQVVQKEWEDATSTLSKKLKAMETHGSVGLRDKAALARENAAAQDRLSTLPSLIMRLEFIAQQLHSDEDSEAYLRKVQLWQDQYQTIRLSFRSANMKAKLNMEKAVKEERELLLGGGEEATVRRRNLQTQAGMVAATESITDGLRRTRQMMAQEVERSANTIETLGDSNLNLRRAKDEYEGQRSLLNRTRHLLTSMSLSDVIDRVILVVGTLMFLSVCTYILLKRFGIWVPYPTSPPIFSSPSRASSTPSSVVVSEGDL